VTGSEYGYSGLVPGATYDWRVKTRDACGQYGDYAACFSFVVAQEPDINCEDLEGHYFGWIEPGYCSSEYALQIVNEAPPLFRGKWQYPMETAASL